MKSPISIMVSIFILCFAFFIGINYAFATLSTQEARTFHQDAIHEIEASNFDADVITKCKEDAAKKGYELSVTKDSFYEENTKYKVNLKYNVKVYIIGVNTSHTLAGYAL